MKKQIVNEVKMTFPSLSQNEAYSRAVAAAFCARMDPTCEEISDIKCAVSEAVTNAIVHGYKNEVGPVTLILKLREDRVFSAEVRDKGCGIEDVARAMEPLYTTDPENERSGMGFTIIESFMDTLRVVSAPGKGTRVIMTKKLTRLPQRK